MFVIYTWLHMFRVDLVTRESLWRHKGFVMHVARKTMYRNLTMHDSTLPVSELRLQTSAS